MILGSTFDIIRVENSKLTFLHSIPLTRNINSPSSLGVISIKVSLENWVLHRLDLSFTSPIFNLFLDLVPRVFAHLDQRWETGDPGKKLLLGVRRYRSSGWICKPIQADKHEARSSRWYFTSAHFHIKFYAVVCYRICEFSRAVFGRGRTVSMETFLNRKNVWRFVEENVSYQFLNQDSGKGNKILSCRLRSCLRLASWQTFSCSKMFHQWDFSTVFETRCKLSAQVNPSIRKYAQLCQAHSTDSEQVQRYSL